MTYEIQDLCSISRTISRLVNVTPQNQSLLCFYLVLIIKSLNFLQTKPWNYNESATQWSFYRSQIDVSKLHLLILLQQRWGAVSGEIEWYCWIFANGLGRSRHTSRAVTAKRPGTLLLVSWISTCRYVYHICLSIDCTCSTDSLAYAVGLRYEGFDRLT